MTRLSPEAEKTLASMRRMVFFTLKEPRAPCVREIIDAGLIQHVRDGNYRVKE